MSREHIILPLAMSRLLGKPYFLLLEDTHIFCEIQLSDTEFTSFGFVPKKDTNSIMLISPDRFSDHRRPNTLTSNEIQEYHVDWLKEYVPVVHSTEECRRLDNGFYVDNAIVKWRVIFTNCKYNVLVNSLLSSPRTHNCVSAMAHLFPELQQCSRAYF